MTQRRVTTASQAPLRESAMYPWHYVSRLTCMISSQIYM